MRNRAWTPREWVSRLLAGAATGCGLLLAYVLLVLIPVWGPRLYKGDERWETVFLVAKLGLPAAVAAGALAGLGWRRSREVRLSRGSLVGCCFAVALVSHMLRPVVSRVHRGGIGPLYEVVPDTLAASFCAVALAVGVWPVGPRSSAPDAEPLSWPTDLNKNEDPGTA